jgi:hypothetical protein
LMDPHISARTVWKILDEVGMHQRKAHKVVYLKQTCRKRADASHGKNLSFKSQMINCFDGFVTTVPFRPSVQSRVTNDFELSTSGVSSRVTGCREHLTVSIFVKFWPILAYFAYK